MIKINSERDSLLTEQSLKLHRDYYMRKSDYTPQQALARAAMCFSDGDDELAQRIYDYSSKQWFMFSSPILSNAIEKGESPKGLPISCFLSHVPDTLEGIIGHAAETAWLSVKGGGVGGHWSSIRNVDDKSCGAIPFIHSIDASMTAYKQGRTRKGAYAAYLDVSHPAMNEFLTIRVPSGGDVNRKCFNIHNAINITDKFMSSVINDKEWEFIDPKDGAVTSTTSARKLWESILTTRHRTGEPYLNFIDVANEGLHPAQKALGLTIKGSNLCNEIHLVTDELRTAVCCLSSVNIEKYDEWKDSDMVKDLVTYLDNVLTYFIRHAPTELEKAKYSAERERSIGIGAMGWHGYLMRKGIPFESALAVGQTHVIFKNIKEKAVEQSRKLAEERGVPSDLLGYNVRNAHLLAVAPNANSSILCNCSPSIEPISSNAYAHRTRAGTHLIKNPILKEKLQSLGKDTDEVWSSIINDEGSVKNLDFLSDYEKDVFKSFKEIDQHWVVEQAGARQEYLCQGQSVNLYFPNNCPRTYINSVHVSAWKKKLKGLYYIRTSSGAVADKVGVSVERKPLSSFLEDTGCLACEG